MTNEKRELTAAQIDAITSTPAAPHNLDARAWCRAAIAAHEALNADGGVMQAEPQDKGSPVAWLLTDRHINDLQVDSVQRLIDRARHAHFTDLIIRINGKDERYQADWLKHLKRAAPTPPTEQQQTNHQNN